MSKPATLVAAVFAAAMLSANVHGQETTQQNPEARTDGKVVSVTKSTMVVRTGDGVYKLFEIDGNTARPQRIAAGSLVSVTATVPTDHDTPALAHVIRVVAPPPPAPPANPDTPVGTTGTVPTPPAPHAEQPADEETVPQSVRQAERTLQRQVSRYHVGVRAGATLDPEVIVIGAQGQIGPFFGDNFWARPNLEFGFGQLTDLISINLEGVYRVPVADRRSRWQVFGGGGLGLSFQKIGFSSLEQGSTQPEVTFGDFSFKTGLNLVLGLQARTGLFLEMRTTVYGSPHAYFVVGYNF
jgi:hypothetical protein